MSKQSNIPQLRFKGFEREWDIDELGNLSKFTSGGTPSRNNNTFWNGNIPWISTSLINFNTIETAEEYITPEAVLKSSAKLFPKGTILIAMYGQGKTRGKVAVLGIDATTNQACGAILTNEKINTHYLFQNLASRYDEIRDLSNDGGQQNLSGGIIKSIKIPFPTLPEQEKIASFLSAIDEKIQQLTRKSALLEQYKKGVMQQLFSSKLRFKDENGEDYADWEEKKLGDVCQIIGGGTPDTNISEYWGGEIQWFTPTEIKSDYVTNSIRTITELGLQKSSAKKMPIGTILLTTRATIGEVSISLKECATNQGFQSLIVKEKNSNIFIFNWIKKNKHELISRANGSTFPEISKSEIEKILIQMPSYEEQQKIAGFLSGIDEKIGVVQGELLKMQGFKKGLLQQLFV